MTKAINVEEFESIHDLLNAKIEERAFRIMASNGQTWDRLNFLSNFKKAKTQASLEFTVFENIHE